MCDPSMHKHHFYHKIEIYVNYLRASCLHTVYAVGAVVPKNKIYVQLQVYTINLYAIKTNIHFHSTSKYCVMVFQRIACFCNSVLKKLNFQKKKYSLSIIILIVNTKYIYISSKYILNVIFP